MNYLDYIIQQKDKIVFPEWKSVAFKDIYKKSYDEIDNATFKQALNNFRKKKDLTRGDIFEMVNGDNLTESFLTILLWGGLNPANINRVMDVFDGIENNLKNVYYLINGNNADIKRNIKQAFSQLLPGGEYHINGIRTSFFTKVLYFFDQRKECLIYDKWGRLQHCALIASKGDSINDYYTISKINKKIVLSVAKDKSEWDLYIDYIKRMQDVSKEIGLDRVDKLEEYLFGYYQKNYDEKNPRRFLLNYLDPFCQISKTEKQIHRVRTHQSNIWVPFKEMDNLINIYHCGQILIKGYCLPIDNQEFRIYVAKKDVPNKHGQTFLCRLLFENGKMEENPLNLFCCPKADEIVQDYFDYNNHGRRLHSYWYQEFYSEDEAISMMDEIIEEIWLSNNNN